MPPLATRETPGAGTPGVQLQSKSLHPENNNSRSDVRFLLRVGGWEFASIFTGCGVAAWRLSAAARSWKLRPRCIARGSRSSKQFRRSRNCARPRT